MHRVLSCILVAASACGRTESSSSTRIHLEVTGGPFAGRYAVHAADTTCAPGLLGPGSLGIRDTDLDSGAAFASLQVVVEPDTTFYLSVVFGGFQPGDREHVIETRPDRQPRGTGAVRLSQDSPLTVIHLAGRTADGMPLTALVRCTANDTT